MHTDKTKLFWGVHRILGHLSEMGDNFHVSKADSFSAVSESQTFTKIVKFICVLSEIVNSNSRFCY
jgi:hypothetical protein